MKRAGLVRDAALLAMVLPFGLLLNWAIQSQRLDDLMFVGVLALPVTILVVTLAKWSKIEVDEL